MNVYVCMYVCMYERVLPDSSARAVPPPAHRLAAEMGLDSRGPACRVNGWKAWKRSRSATGRFLEPAVVDGHDLVSGSDHIRVDGSLDRFLRHRVHVM